MPTVLQHVPVRVDLNNINDVVNKLAEGVSALNLRLTDMEQSMHVLAGRTDLVNALSTKVEFVGTQNETLNNRLANLTTSMQSQVDRAVDAGVTHGMLQMKSLTEERIIERLDVFHAQYRMMMEQVNVDINNEKQLLRDQIAYNMELSARDIRRDLVDLVARVDSNTELIKEGVDLKRHLADVQGRMDGMQQRMENLNGEVLQRHAAASGLKGRLENVEGKLSQQHMALVAHLEEIRNEMDAKAVDGDMRRLEGKFEMYSNEVKSLRVAGAKAETQISDLQRLVTSVHDLNERVNSTISNFESTAISLNEDVGSIKGQFEHTQARQANVERKTAELDAKTRNAVAELQTTFTSHMEGVVNSRCVTLEARVAQKLDSVLIEGRNWRNDNRQLLEMLEDKVEEHEQKLDKVFHVIDNSVNERLNQNGSDIRDVARRVDQHTSERKEAVQDMRRQLSQLQEVVGGVQQSYDGLVTDSVQRNEAWAEMGRELKGRVQRSESQLSHWQSLMDTAMDDLRNQANTLATTQMQQINTQVESLGKEVQRTHQAISRIEEDARIAAKALGEIDEQVNHELADMREIHAQVNRDTVGFKTRLEALETRRDGDGQRIAKALLDIDVLVNTHVRELKNAIHEREEEIDSVKRNMEYFVNTKLAQLESREVREVSHTRGSAALTAEVTHLRGQVDSLTTTRSSLEEIAADLRTLQHKQAELNNQTDRLEGLTRNLQSGVEDLKGSTQQSISELKNTNVDMSSTLTTYVQKFDPVIKKVETQMAQLTRVCTNLNEKDEKLQAALAEIQNDNVDIHTALNTAHARLELVAGKPLATEQAVRSIQTTLEGAHTRLQQDIQNIHFALQDAHEKFALDTTSKTKSMSTAILQLRQRLEKTESGLEEHTASVNTLVDDLRSSGEEKNDVATRRLDLVGKELQTVRATTQKLEVQLTDARALRGTFNDMTDRMTTTLEELRTSTIGISNDLGQLKARVDKSERGYNEVIADLQQTVHENLGRDVQDLTVKVDDKFNRWDDKFLLEIEQNRSTLNAVKSVIEDFRKSISGVVQRQETVDKLHQFGIKGIKDLKEEQERVAVDLANKAERARNDMERHVRTVTASYDSRLKAIQEREEALGHIKQMSAQMVADMRTQLEEMRKKQEQDFYNITAVFEINRTELQAIVESGQHEARLKLLHKKPVFSQLITQIEGVRNEIQARLTMGGLGDPVSGLFLGSSVLPPVPTTPATAASMSGVGGFSGMGTGFGGGTGSVISSVASNAPPKPAVGMDGRDVHGGGMEVTVVTPGGPASNAGIQVGDVITQLDGTRLPNRAVYKRFIQEQSPGDAVKHTIRRSGEEIECRLVLGSARKKR